MRKAVFLLLAFVVLALAQYLPPGNAGTSPSSGSGIQKGNGGGGFAAATADTDYQSSIVRNVTTAGAKCDGVTDDTTALNTAAGTPGTWYFPQNGVCPTQGITFTASNIAWVGNGTALKHLVAGAANYLITDSGHSQIDISGFIFDDNGVLQTTSSSYMTTFNSGGPYNLHGLIYRNSGTARPTIGGAFFFASTFDFTGNTVESTITSTQVFNDGGAVPVRGRIENNRLDGSNTNAIFSQFSYVAGAQESISGNHISNVGTDAVDGQCGGNVGECGNAIVVTHSFRVNVSDNISYNPKFSCVRVSYSNDINVHGTVCEGAGENALYSEFPSATGAGGNIFSFNVVKNSTYGFENTNIPALATSEPDIVTSNKFVNIYGYAIHAENALVSNNGITNAAIGIEVGHGTAGYGNLLASNSCNHCGVQVLIDQGLSSAPNNQVGTLNVQNPINAALPNIVASDGNAVVTVTNATNSAGTQNLTFFTAPTAGATYLLRAFFGQTDLNGLLCTVGTVSGAGPFTANCTGMTASANAWVTNAATSTGAEPIYSSGTTFAYALPSTLSLFSPLRIGTAIASAATIAPTAPVTHITGTTSITTITAPGDFTITKTGGCLVLIPDGLWSTGTSGNIAIATTGVVSKALTECYDPATSKWYPSY